MYPVDNNSGLGSGPIKTILGTGIPSSKVFYVPQNSKNFRKFPWFQKKRYIFLGTYKLRLNSDIFQNFQALNWHF